MAMNRNLVLLISSALLLIIIIILMLNFPSIMGFISSNNDNKSISFKIATFAVCEDKEGYQHCQDKIFASCNGTLIEVNTNEVECLGVKYNVINMNLGETYQAKDWNDPRETGFLTAWAVSD